MLEEEWARKNKEAEELWASTRHARSLNADKMKPNSPRIHHFLVENQRRAKSCTNKWN